MQPKEFGQKLRAEKEANLAAMANTVGRGLRGAGAMTAKAYGAAKPMLNMAAGSMANSAAGAVGGAAATAGLGYMMNGGRPQAAPSINIHMGGMPNAPRPSAAAEVPAAFTALKQASFAGAPMGPGPGAMTDGHMSGTNPFEMFTGPTHQFNPAGSMSNPGNTIGNLLPSSAANPIHDVSGAGQGLSRLLKPSNISPSPSSAAGQVGQTLGGEVKNVVGDMLRDGLAGRGGATSALKHMGSIRNITQTLQPFQGVAQMGMNALSNMPLKTASTRPVATALVAMAVKRAAEMEKDAAGLGGLLSGIGSLARTAPAALASGAKMVGNAGKFVNTGSKNFLRATGNALQGGGQVGQAVGGLAGRVGRFGQQMGTGIIGAAENIPTRMLGTNMGRPIRDVTQAAGHAMRATGSAIGGTGGGVGLVGKGMNAAGQGLKRVSQMGYGIPTAAAIPVAAGAAMAAKPFVPNVGLQNPVEASANVNFRNPITLNWDKK
jgi:hypothetical protein